MLTGNVAAQQHQHGIYGDIFEAALFVDAGNVLDQNSALILLGLADECADRWRQKASGMWEIEERQHYTMSKISIWQALARAVELAEDGHLPSTCVPRWSRERVAACVEQHCWSEAKRAYTFHAGTERLDASLVLAARFGFGRDDAGRMSSTCDAVRRELGHGPWIYR